MNYALIENGQVTNLIWLHYSNAHEFPNAVPLNGALVWIGDTYDGEHFYRDGERVKTAEEILIDELNDAKNALKVLGVIEDEQVYE